MGAGEGRAGAVRYRVQIKRSAQKGLGRLHAHLQERVRAQMDALTDEPRPRGVRRLKGQRRTFWRLRVGDCRVIYEIDDAERLVTVAAIDSRLASDAV